MNRKLSIVIIIAFSVIYLFSCKDKADGKFYHVGEEKVKLKSLAKEFSVVRSYAVSYNMNGNVVIWVVVQTGNTGEKEILDTFEAKTSDNPALVAAAIAMFNGPDSAIYDYGNKEFKLSHEIIK